MHWVTLGVKAFGCLGFIPTLWLSYEVEWEGGICFQMRGGPRGVLTSEQNEKMKKKKRNKTKILSVVKVLGCKVV